MANNLKYAREHMAKIRRERKELGLAYHCGHERDCESVCYCSECKANRNKNDRRRSAQYVKDDRCGICGRPRNKYEFHCDDCYDKRYGHKKRITNPNYKREVVQNEQLY